MHRSFVQVALAASIALAGAHANAASDAPIAPPELRLDSGFIQVGAALTAELLARTGDICPSGAPSPCAIGSGGGLTLRGGYRFHQPFYVGAAYEFSKQDAHKSMSLAILQQARAEGRYYWPVEGTSRPYFGAGFGAVAYGSEWSPQALGVMAFVGLGIEFEFSRTSALAFAVTYRPIFLGSWRDPSNVERPSGVLSMIGVEISLEQRFPMFEPRP